MPIYFPIVLSYRQISSKKSFSILEIKSVFVCDQVYIVQVLHLIFVNVNHISILILTATPPV